MTNSTGSSTTSPYASESARWAIQASEESSMPQSLQTAIESIEDYARREPMAFAAWVFGIGFVLGWKLKPW
jgi:hypothetical protein